MNEQAFLINSVVSVYDTINSRNAIATYSTRASNHISKSLLRGIKISNGEFFLVTFLVLGERRMKG